MVNSERFLHSARKMLKAADLQSNETGKNLEDPFVRALFMLPPDMAVEIFRYHYRSWKERGEENPYLLMERLVPVIDFLSEEEEEDRLTDGELDLIRELSSDFALDLTDTLLHYIMQRMIERRRI